jgi:hypothetical protein
MWFSYVGWMKGMWPIGTTGRGEQVCPLLLCIWEYSGSNFGLGNGCPASDFSLFSSVLSRECQDSSLSKFSIASISFLIYSPLIIILSFFLSLSCSTRSCRCRGLLLHLLTLKDTHTHSLGRTPPDEGSARPRDLYLTTHNSQETAMPPAGFESAIPASERPQTHALDRAATGIGQL